MKLMPQEIEVRYVLPALRRELAQKLSEKGLKQREIAEILNITPAAVSQYLKAKRGTTTLRAELSKEAEKSAARIIEDKELAQSEIYHLTQIVKKKAMICAIHRLHDDVPGKCDICFK